MKKRTILTCSVTGGLTLPSANPHLPITPEQIANSALEAAAAGAAMVHIHVRDPKTGEPSGELSLYREVVERIRARNSAVLINLSTGLGGSLQVNDADPRIAGPATDLMPPLQRVEHVTALKPDVCSLDLNTMTFGKMVVMNTPGIVKIMAGAIYDSGVKPELELFDTGDMHLANDLIGAGVLKVPAMCCIVMGIKYGIPATGEALGFAKTLLPREMEWTAFSIGRLAFPMLMQAYLLGGNVRIGMEDTLHIERDVKTKGNGELVEKSKWLIEKIGGALATPEEARRDLGLLS